MKEKQNILKEEVYIKKRCKWSLYTRLKWKRRKDIQAIISEAIKWCEQKWGPNNRRSDVLWIDISWKKSECAGVYQYQDNEITIFVKEHLTVRDLIDTVIHEYTHYKQPMSKYAKLLEKNGYKNHPLEIEAINKAKTFRKECWYNIKQNIWQKQEKD